MTITKLDCMELKDTRYSVYPYDGYNLEEILGKFYEAIKECNDLSFSLQEFNNWIISQGLTEEILKQLTKIDWDNIVNSELYQKVLANLDKINEQLKSIIELKNNYMYNPIYYGADPTGIKPSSDAINQCIIANKGKSIKFSPGKYLLDKPILTPYYVDEQVNIDFSGSLLYTEEPLDYVIGVGYYNSGDNKPNHDNYSSESCYAILQNFVINAPNANVGVMTKNYYWYPRIKNCTIFNTTIGLQTGTITGEVWSSDLYLENAFLTCE